MLTIETLRDEHTGILTVLEQLELAVAAAEHGASVPADVFADVQEFFAVFVDRCHDSKEEQVLFPALGSAGATLQHELEREHARGRKLAHAYAAALDGYAPGDRAAAHLIAGMARTYVQFLRRHIELETEQLFPLIERNLSAREDAVAVREFERIEEEQIGPGTHERLHGMIAALAPRIDAALLAGRIG